MATNLGPDLVLLTHKNQERFMLLRRKTFQEGTVRSVWILEQSHRQQDKSVEIQEILRAQGPRIDRDGKRLANSQAAVDPGPTFGGVGWGWG